MSHPVLWSLDPHTAAKHRVLRSYVEAWIPIMAQQALSIAHVEQGTAYFFEQWGGTLDGLEWSEMPAERTLQPA